MMKLQQSGNRDNYTPYGSLSFPATQGGKGKGNGYFRGGGHDQTDSSNQDQTDKSFLDKEIIRTVHSTPQKACPMWKHLQGKKA